MFAAALMGQRAIKRQSADYFPLIVGNHILGGGILTSRLNDAIREKKGLAYHVYSNVMPMKEKGPFIIGLSTRKDKATTALKIARNTLKDFVSKGATAKELKASKQNIVNSFPLRIASNASLLGSVMRISAYQLPLNYLDTYRKLM